MSTSKVTSATGTNAVLQKPRMGQISFVNCLPIVLPIVKKAVTFEADVVLESPSKLNAMFEQGALDVGAMSSFYFLQQADLRLIPNVSISCTGQVGSVLFFTKQPHEKLTPESKVVASAQSATSVNLLKVLCNKHLGFIPQIEASFHPDLENDDVDAALVIGDRALEVDAAWSAWFHRTDMGQWWVESFDLPMVFGVWAARNGWAEENADAYNEIAAALVSAKELGFGECWYQVLDEAHRRTGLGLQRLERYYRKELNFQLTDKHLKGLEQYRAECQRLGLL